MLGAIIDFLKGLNPEIIIQAPSRVNLINPLDAVEGDYWMPSVAINGKKNPLSAFIYLKKSRENSKVRVYSIKNVDGKFIIQIKAEEELEKNIEEFNDKFQSDFKLIYGSIYRLSKTNSLFLDRFKESNIEIGFLSTIPRQSGLGGSAAITVATLYGLAHYFNLYNNLNLKNGDFPINRDIIAEMATKVEDEDLNITAGYADRYVISRGGLSFCSYSGKLYHKDLRKEPLAIYDRIDETYGINKLPIILCFSGVFHESGDIHKRLRELYLANDNNIIDGYKLLAKIAWKSRFALMSHDWEKLGEYFKENTKIMNHIMENAGFKFGIGLANNILINLIEDHPDVYAAKLTGAGGGGCVFALVKPSKEEAVLQEWKLNLTKIIEDQRLFKSRFPSYPFEIAKKLENAEFYRIFINKTGVKKI